jgi:hypothetical protein
VGITVKKKKTVKKISIFFTVFPTDQSEAELQIASCNSRHDIAAFEVIIEIEMHLHGPAQKNTLHPWCTRDRLMGETEDGITENAITLFFGRARSWHNRKML